MAMAVGKTVFCSLFFVCHLTARTFLIEDEDGNKKPCECYLMLYRPVCGENGKTYTNDCEARCDDIRQESLRSQSMYNKMYFLR